MLGGCFRGCGAAQWSRGLAVSARASRRGRLWLALARRWRVCCRTSPVRLTQTETLGRSLGPGGVALLAAFSVTFGDTSDAREMKAKLRKRKIEATALYSSGSQDGGGRVCKVFWLVSIKLGSAFLLIVLKGLTVWPPSVLEKLDEYHTCNFKNHGSRDRYCGVTCTVCMGYIFRWNESLPEPKKTIIALESGHFQISYSDHLSQAFCGCK